MVQYKTRLDGTADYLSSKDINIQTAQSSIGDADIAAEMMNIQSHNFNSIFNWINGTE